MKKKIIIVTDGDNVAKRAVERATEQLGGRCISASHGNPTKLTGPQIANLIEKSKGDPIVVMVDDRGQAGEGRGERVTEYLVNHTDIEVIGALAVASNSPYVEGITPEVSITNQGNVIDGAVDKDGQPANEELIFGDTVENLELLGVEHVIGIGDIGKMCGKDDLRKGVPITLKALKEILSRNNYN